jgi:cation diffusion facilitator family transporter
MKQPDTTHTHDARYLAIRNVTLLGVVINLLLAVVKIVFGWTGNSQALIADGLHSLSDLISDGVVLVAAKLSNRKADEKHPYGYARFETVATILIGVLLVGVAIWMATDASQRLFETVLTHPNPLTLAIAVISILSKEALFQYTIYVAESMRSQMVRANAWHHRSDAISSVIVFVGIVGSMAGLTSLDAVAAIVVSLMIMNIGWELGWRGVNQLTDKGLSPETLQQIKQIIKSIDGVRTLHKLRSRYMGEKAFMDVHILVNPYVSVSEGHHIGEIVEMRLINEMEELADVTVHIDPENDEQVTPSLTLPLRQEITDYLQNHCWKTLEAHQAIERIGLHYLAGKITVEVYLPLEVAQNLAQAQDLAQQFIELATRDNTIHAVKVYFS